MSPVLIVNYEIVNTIPVEIVRIQGPNGKPKLGAFASDSIHINRVNIYVSR